MKYPFTPSWSALKTVWKDTLQEIREAELPIAASSLAYTTILSIVPLIAVSFSIFKAFGGMEKLYGVLEPIIFENLAEGADEKTLEVLRSFVENIHGGTLGATGFVGLLITSMAMLFSVEKSINKVWKSKVTRPIFYRVATYWLFITLGPVAVSLGVGLVSSESQTFNISRYLPSGSVLFFVLVVGFYLLYKYIPNRWVHWKAALIGSVLTSVCWLLAKSAYSLYIRKVVTYDKIYGSLGAIPILLLWIYVAWLVVLGGAALSAALQRRYDLE